MVRVTVVVRNVRAKIREEKSGGEKSSSWTRFSPLHTCLKKWIRVPREYLRHSSSTLKRHSKDMLGCNSKGGVSSTNLLAGQQQSSTHPPQSEALEMTPHGVGSLYQSQSDGPKTIRPAQLDVTTLQRGKAFWTFKTFFATPPWEMPQTIRNIPCSLFQPKALT